MIFHRTRVFPKVTNMESQARPSVRNLEFPSVAMSLVGDQQPPRLEAQPSHPSKPPSIICACAISFLHIIPPSNLTSPIVTLVIGQEQRIFAAHENVLCASPFFDNVLRREVMDLQNNKRIALPDEEPEIFSSVLEFLYKGDYYPRLVHNKRQNSWEIEQPVDDGRGSVESTVYHHGIDGELLKDTVIYCAAEKYGLDELKRVALRKQGLRKSSASFVLHHHQLLTCPQNLVSKPVPFLLRLDTRTPTHPTPTRS